MSWNDYLRDFKNNWADAITKMTTETKVFDDASKKLLEQLSNAEEIKKAVQSMIISDTASMYIKSLEVKDLVLIILSKEVSMTSVEKMVDSIKANPAFKNVPMVVIPPGMTIAAVSEEEMNEMGWFRKKDCKRYLRPEV